MSRLDVSDIHSSTQHCIMLVCNLTLKTARNLHYTHFQVLSSRVELTTDFPKLFWLLK